MFSWSMLIPKNMLTKFIIAQAAKTMTNPIKADVIWFLAASVAALSPPEVMYLIPPQTNIKKNINAATINTSIIKAEIILAIVMLLSPENCPPGIMLIGLWAKTVESNVMLIIIIALSKSACQGVDWIQNTPNNYFAYQKISKYLKVTSYKLLFPKKLY